MGQCFGCETGLPSHHFAFRSATASVPGYAALWGHRTGTARAPGMENRPLEAWGSQRRLRNALQTAYKAPSVTAAGRLRSAVSEAGEGRARSPLAAHDPLRSPPSVLRGATDSSEPDRARPRSNQPPSDIWSRRSQEISRSARPVGPTTPCSVLHNDLH